MTPDRDNRSYEEVLAEVSSQVQAESPKSHAIRSGVVSALIAALLVIAGFAVADKRAADRDEEARADATEVVETLRAACDATNRGLRDPLFDAINTAARVVSDPAAKHDLKEQAENMVTAAADYPLEPGSAEVDCLARYPLPD